MPPPVPWMVNLWVPVGAFFGMVMVRTDLPAPGAGIGLTLKVVPDPPDRVMAELKPLPIFVVMVEVPLLPRAMVSVVGAAAMAKLPFAPAVTVRVTVVVSVRPPPTPLTVIGYVPATVVEATVRVRVDVPEPGAPIEVGLKPTVTPVGWPVADKATAELKPPAIVLVMVEVPLLP